MAQDIISTIGDLVLNKLL
ncbi:delta-lysin family phenol-soluble modulin [Staphylococcus aureus]